MASEVVSSSNHHPVAVIIDLSYNNCLSTSASALHTASALVDVGCLLSAAFRCCPKAVMAGIFYLSPQGTPDPAFFVIH